MRPLRSSPRAVSALPVFTTLRVPILIAGMLVPPVVAALAGCGGHHHSSSGGSTTPSVSLVGTSSTLAEGATETFTATVTGESSQAVTFSATGGTITSDGVYTAPATAGVYTVTAASVADPSVTGTFTVTVTAPVSIGGDNVTVN